MGVENDNENQNLIKGEWVREMMEVVVEGLETILMEKIKRVREKDKEAVRVVEEMKKAGIRNLRDNEWEIEKELVLKEGKVYVLKNEELRMEVIQLHYDTPVAGYRGNYWLLGVTKNVGKYVEECDAYQRMKNRTETLVGKLMVNEIPEKS